MAKKPGKTAAKPAEAKEVPTEKKGKSTFLLIGLLVLGFVLGGAGSAFYFLNIKANAATDQKAEKELEEKEPPEFVKIDRMTVPLIDPGGRLNGYLSLDLSFEIAKADAEFVKFRLPIVRHVINETFSTTPITLDAKKQALDYPLVQGLLRNAGNKALGKPAIRSVQIVGALPI